MKTEEYESVNLYFQDESRFGLMTYICLLYTSEPTRLGMISYAVTGDQSKGLRG